MNILQDDTDKVMVISLDTNLETNHFFDFACGIVGEDQWSFLDRIIGDLSNADNTKVLFFHHHPFMHNDPFMSGHLYGVIIASVRDYIREKRKGKYGE